MSEGSRGGPPGRGEGAGAIEAATVRPGAWAGNGAGCARPGEAGAAGGRASRRASAVYATLGLLITDLAMVTLGFVAGYYLRFTANLFYYDEYQPFGAFVGALALQVAITPAVFLAGGLYRPVRSVSWLDQFYAVFAGVSVGTALAIVVGAFLWRDAPFSRLMIALSWLAMVTLVMVGRVTIHSVGGLLRQRGVDEERVVIVGNGEPAQLVLERIRRSPRLGYRTVGFVAEAANGGGLGGLPLLGTAEQVGAIVRSHQIDQVIVAAPTMSTEKLLDLVGQCRLERVDIRVFPDLFQLMTSGVDIGDLNGLPLVSVKDVALRGWNLALKRGLDLAGSAVALALLSPVLLAVAVLIKLTSPGGGAFYCQERVGLDGKPFQVVKFRTMRPDAEAKTGPVWASAGDPRRTALGTYLRRSSLDELPQLINVLIGEMSLVGPRPERPYFVEQFAQTVPGYFDRHREKAGLTGWAQVNGLRGNSSIEERTAYDLWYVENWSIWLDIKILLMTPLAVLRGDNAY